MDHAEKVGRVTNSIFLNLTVQPTDQMGNVINRGFVRKLYFKTCEKPFSLKTSKTGGLCRLEFCLKPNDKELWGNCLVAQEQSEFQAPTLKPHFLLLHAACTCALIYSYSFKTESHGDNVDQKA